jgi:WD40 repeat protein
VIETVNLNETEPIRMINFTEKEDFMILTTINSNVIAYKIMQNQFIKTKNNSFLYCYSIYSIQQEIKSIESNSEYNLIVFSTIENEIYFFNLRNGEFINKIKLLNDEPVDIIKISPLGKIFFYSNETKLIYLYDVNGNLISSHQSEFDISVLVIFSKYFMYGGLNGEVIIRKIKNFGLKNKFDLENSKVVSFDYTEDLKYLFFGLKNGRILSYSNL